VRTNRFFTIEMLPALHGDCLWVEYGTATETHRLLIDGGPIGAFAAIHRRLCYVPHKERSFDVIVLTHVDADHVEGLVRLFADLPLQFRVDRVWFNGWQEMQSGNKLLGPAEGEFFSALLANRVPDAWRAGRHALVVARYDSLPVIRLRGGMKITLLSPTQEALARMGMAWGKALHRSKLRPGDLEVAWQMLSRAKRFLPRKGLLSAGLETLLGGQFVKDDAVANGSSIAFLAEYAGRSALFLADAHADVIAESIRRVCAERKCQRLAVNAMKVSHHGSKHNTSEDMLLRIECPSYLISTNGDKFGHPDEECIARIIEYGKPQRMYFNYACPMAKRWLSHSCQQQYGYQAIVRPTRALTAKIVL
jgi:hypothetical protein